MKVKRTYNLSTDVIDTVKTLVEDMHAARTQDALIEAAVRQYERQWRDREDTRRWSEAGSDAAFQSELARLWAEYEPEDRAAWMD